MSAHHNTQITPATANESRFNTGDRRAYLIALTPDELHLETLLLLRDHYNDVGQPMTLNREISRKMDRWTKSKRRARLRSTS